MKAWLALALFASACTGGSERAVDGARIALADGIVPAADAPTVAVVPGKAWTLPDGDIVRVAIDRDVPFGEVADVILWSHANAHKKQLSLLVKDRRDNIRAIEMPPVPSTPRIRVVTYSDGKACVSLPDVDEAKCVKARGGDNVDRSYVRELVREAMRESGIARVAVEIELGLAWANVVRVVDGARTCCGDATMDVGIAVH